MKRIIVLCLSLLCLSSLAQAVSVGDDKSVSILCNNSSTLQKSIKNKSVTTSKRKSKKKKSKKNRVKTKRPMHKKKKHSKKLKKSTSKKNSKSKKQSSKIRLNVNPKNRSQAIRNSERFAAEMQAALRKKFGSDRFDESDQRSNSSSITFSGLSLNYDEPQSIEDKARNYLNALGFFYGRSEEKCEAAIRIWNVGYDNFNTVQLKAACALQYLGFPEFSREQLDRAVAIAIPLQQHPKYECSQIVAAAIGLHDLEKSEFAETELTVANELIKLGYKSFNAEQLHCGLTVYKTDSSSLISKKWFEAASRLIGLSGDKQRSSEDFISARILSDIVGCQFSLEDFENIQMIRVTPTFHPVNKKNLDAARRLRAIGKTQAGPAELWMAMDLISFNHADFSLEFFDFAMSVSAACSRSSYTSFSEKVLNLGLRIQTLGYDNISPDLLRYAQLLDKIGYIEFSREQLYAASFLYHYSFSKEELDTSVKIISLVGGVCTQEQFAVGKKLIELGYNDLSAEQLETGVLANANTHIVHFCLNKFLAFTRLSDLGYDLTKVDSNFACAARRLIEIGLSEFSTDQINAAVVFVDAGLKRFSTKNLEALQATGIEMLRNKYFRYDLSQLIDLSN